ncbi:hypothetical protein GCM10027084_05520 [Pseudoxanthomonas sangjuensis]|uniref:LPS translocon maturation chaperone LptM n=1 Tax=Pseudoxanthomonas sangjuensis TaxID=1503750 RepID=UPI001390DB9C|nr:lipoprotein [Pseudoxanthomonas sangjuensis]KAF1707121.1 hypothetical protein CSC71_13425 [Pseudoxanthomonas sangjuensis]
MKTELRIVIAGVALAGLAACGAKGPLFLPESAAPVEVPEATPAPAPAETPADLPAVPPVSLPEATPAATPEETPATTPTAPETNG